jgi:CheY-like chemotaxis protein
MEQGGRLTIKTENVLIDGRYCETHPWARPGRFVLLEVTDTGVGMTPEVRERAFEPFFTTKGRHGTGLGLATVYGIVQQHGGLIHVHSKPSHGTRFEIYLPADARGAEPEDARGAEAMGEDLEALPPRGNETILFAEDEAQVRRAVVQMLQRAGYRTIAVANGKEAVRALRDTKEVVHLALLDVVMPEMGGPQAWEQMRELRPNLRVLFASGYADQRYREQLSEDAEVLEKPFRMDELLRRVRSKLDRGP